MRARIFLLYLSLALSITLCINLLIFAFTAWKIEAPEAAGLFLAGSCLSLAWLIFTRRRIRKGHLQMVTEVAFSLYPVAGLLSLLLSIAPAVMM